MVILSAIFGGRSKVSSPGVQGRKNSQKSKGLRIRLVSTRDP